MLQISIVWYFESTISVNKKDVTLEPGLSPVISKNVLGPVIQSMVSLTSSLSGLLVKCFTTL